MKIHGFFASQNRPLAGIMVLNIANRAKFADLFMKKFPSPCGDYGS